MAKRLTAQQRKFISEYLVDFNATAAAERAGYSAANTAAGNHLLRHPHVLAEVNRRCLAMQSRLEINGDHVRRGLAAIATDYRQPTEGGPSWGDRIMAWRELGKLLGLYTNKIQVTGSLTLVDLLLAADRKTESPAIAATH